jgi:hypothetical protein
MKGMRATFLLVGVLCGCEPEEYAVEAPCGAAAENVARENLVGHWSGQGRQSDGYEWRIDVDVTSRMDGVCARVWYPELRCGGYWTCSDRSETSMHGTEHITQGGERCVDSEFAAALSDEGALELHAQADEIEAFARLTR